MDKKTRKFNELKLLRIFKNNRSYALNFIRRSLAHLSEEKIKDELDIHGNIPDIKEPKFTFDELINKLDSLGTIKAKKTIHYEYYDSGDEILTTIDFKNKKDEKLIYDTLDYIKYAYKISEYKNAITMFKKLKSLSLDVNVYQEFSKKLYSQELTNLIDLDILDLDLCLPLLLISIIRAKDIDSIEMLLRLDINNDSFYLLEEDDKVVLKELLEKYFEITPKSKVTNRAKYTYYSIQEYLKNGYLEDEELIFDN